MSATMSGRRPLLDPPLDEYYADGNHSVSDSPAALLAAPLVRQSQPALVGHWAFDEGSGTVAADSSGNNNTGTMLNGPAWTQGKVGAGAVRFDGVDDRLTTANPTSVPNDFTISFWANPRSTHEIDPEGTSGTYGASGQRYAWWPTFRPGADAGAGVSVGTNGVSVYEHGFNYVPATLVFEGQISGWTHVAVVYENARPKLYVNGVLVKTGLASPRNAVWATPQDVGGNVYGFYDGQLDDVRFYGGAVSPSTILALAGTQGTGLTGRYYDNLDFTAYKLTRADAAVNFDWGGGSPDASVGQDEFSVRWTGTVVPGFSETYTIHTTTDDGVRLWVDGQLIIDKWVDQAPTEWAGQVALQAGRPYALRMEFYERGGGAQARLQWSSASRPKEVIPQASLYGCWKGPDQFTRDFYQGALAVQGPEGEVRDWTSQLTQAQGDSQLLGVAQALGAQVFTSQAYAARNRGDADYVTDLYRAYLQREPDQSGLNHWAGQITACGSDQQCRAARREEVRAAFGGSGEFGEKVRAMCGTSAAAPANGGGGYNFATARLDPDNRTGGVGADPLSRNFNWGVPLVSLPGRAGLDLGLALSYNSLVWTKDAGGVTFDADRGFPGPGFRLGFPTIQPRFYNPQTGKNAYLLIMPSGERVELRQAGANLYESADSSYLQLTDGAGLSLLATDGTRLSFALLNGEYRCHEVKDRNGNFLTVAHYADGRVDKVTDTLGRAVTFNYDPFQNLISITQPWKRETKANPSGVDEAHRWATFGYENLTLQPLFSGLAVMGEQPGTVIPVLTQVSLADGSYYKFSYNQWGQVWKVTHYAADSVDAQGWPDDSHALSRTRLDLPGSDLTAASSQTDCPRFTQQRTWVEYGVMNQSGEVTTAYSPWAPNMASCETTLPDGTTKHVTAYATSADRWMKGLTTKEEVWSGGQLAKTTTLAWEHDGGADALYPTNARVTQTSISDPQGHARTTRVHYTAPEDFRGESGFTGTLSLRLPRKVEECAATCSTVLRSTVNDYRVPNLGRYVERRVLGLVRYRYVYDGAEAGPNLRSKVGFVYDELNSAQDTFLAPLATPASQHDAAAYGQAPDAGGQGGLRWRGNANRVRRYSVDQETGAVGAYAENRTAFNVTGTAAYTKDAAGHQISLGYADAFFQNVNRTHADPQHRLQTYAYPTTLTDPDGFAASTWYNYDVGAPTEVQTPRPNEPAYVPGPLSRHYYDAAGRLVRSLVVDTGSYTRVVYPAKMDLVETYTLVESGKEARSTQVLDGVGRTRAASRYLPPPADTGAGDYPSNYNYAGQKFDYDVTGRLVRQTNPAEVTSGWLPAGDDAAGWVYTHQSYDWKGRPLTATRDADGTVVEYKYGGCGCAGGEVVTARDEAGRRRRVAYDVLGRVWQTQVLTIQPKTEPLSEGGDADVYSTTTNTYDALDRVLGITERAGVSGAPQLTTMSYDGHGRLSARHLPEQDADRPTVWTYNDDDTVAAVTDARGVKVTYGYNNRHLVTSVRHDTTNVVAEQNVAPTSDVTLSYDAAGNRRWMQDGFGTVTYSYDILSRLSSESRAFSDPDDASVGFTRGLSYEYNLAGGLTSLTDPEGLKLIYGYDRAGQLKEVKGATAYGGVTDYARDMQYRAWGAVKAMTYGNGRALSATYNARLQVESFQVPGIMASQYRYTSTPTGNDNDGLVKFVKDLTQADGPFDRSYAYDLAGRLTQAKTGTGARGSAFSSGPYHESFAYDVWGNTTSRTGRHWTQAMTPHTAAYTNNREAGTNYDADGRPTAVGSLESVYDAAGLPAWSRDAQARGGFAPGLTVSQGHDSDGRRLKHAELSETTYYVRSTVLGEVVAELGAGGQWRRGYVYGAGGALLATRANGFVEWVHEDPVTGSRRRTGHAGTQVAAEELDPLGVDVGRCNPYFGGCDPEGGISSGKGGLLSRSRYGNAPDRRAGCSLEGMMVSCDLAAGLVASGAARVQDRSYVSVSGRRHPIPREADAPMPGQGGGGPGGTTALAFRGGGGIMRGGINESVTVTAGPHEPVLMGGAMIVGGVLHSLYVPQNPTPMDRLLAKARSLRDQPNRNDCKSLVELIRYSGEIFDNVIGATNALGLVLTGGDVVRHAVGTLRGGDGYRNPMVRFGSVGFRNDLRADATDNQVDHFMGGLLRASAEGHNALDKMNARETRLNDVHDVADRNLNAISVPLGVNVQKHNLEFGRHPGAHTSQFLNSLADSVNERVCDPNQ